MKQMADEKRFGSEQCENRNCSPGDIRLTAYLIDGVNPVAISPVFEL